MVMGSHLSLSLEMSPTYTFFSQKSMKHEQGRLLFFFFFFFFAYFDLSVPLNEQE